jgi:hypothetical protein
MIKAIREAGRTPIQRNTFYEPLKDKNGETDAADISNGARSKILEANLATG